ncbi:hypothetical protein LguiA_021019 [Lonicera macranthoides]
MAEPSFPIPICFKTLLSHIIEKLEVNRHSCGYRVRSDGLFRAYIEIQVVTNEENKLFWGLLSHRTEDTMQSAAKDAILYLKKKFNFEVQDVNLSEMHYYIWCNNELDRDYNMLLEENKRLKKK